MMGTTSCSVSRGKSSFGDAAKRAPPSIQRLICAISADASRFSSIRGHLAGLNQFEKATRLHFAGHYDLAQLAATSDPSGVAQIEFAFVRFLGMTSKTILGKYRSNVDFKDQSIIAHIARLARARNHEEQR